MEKMAEEQTLDFNISGIEKIQGTKFSGTTLQEKREFVSEYRRNTKLETERIMAEGLKKYEENKGR